MLQEPRLHHASSLTNRIPWERKQYPPLICKALLDKPGFSPSEYVPWYLYTECMPCNQTCTILTERFGYWFAKVSVICACVCVYVCCVHNMHRQMFAYRLGSLESVCVCMQTVA